MKESVFLYSKESCFHQVNQMDINIPVDSKHK